MVVEARGRRGASARRKAKEAAVGAAARVLFYPTLLYNVVRSKVQAEFRWWDEVDQDDHLFWKDRWLHGQRIADLAHRVVALASAKRANKRTVMDALTEQNYIRDIQVPFRRDVPRLQKLGVHAVITLNEPFETLVPSSMYQSRGIDHLVIPTRGYMFAPSLDDINQAVDFIHRNASCEKITYIHCKAGRGRSTTIVLCYLVKYKNMTPAAAFEHVRSKRARVLLTRSQWKVVREFGKRNAELPAAAKDSGTASPAEEAVLVTEAELDANDAPVAVTEDASLSCQETIPSRSMIKMLSCLFPSRL